MKFMPSSAQSSSQHLVAPAPRDAGADYGADCTASPALFAGLRSDGKSASRIRSSHHSVFLIRLNGRLGGRAGQQLTAFTFAAWIDVRVYLDEVSLVM